MALKRVRYEDEGETFRIEGGGGIDFARDGSLVMPIDLVEDVSIAHFANALRRYEEYYGGYIEAIFISETAMAMSAGQVAGSAAIRWPSCRRSACC